MRRIIIFGNSGSGKSTLAKQLVSDEGLAHLDLDEIAWLPSTPPERDSVDSSRRKIEEFTASNDNWVIEGCYSDLLELIAPMANEAIFLNLSIEQCVENAKNRPWEPHKYKSKEEQDNNLNMLINWIKQYYERKDTFSLTAHKKLFTDFVGRKTMLTRNENHIQINEKTKT